MPFDENGNFIPDPVDTGTGGGTGTDPGTDTGTIDPSNTAEPDQRDVLYQLDRTLASDSPLVKRARTGAAQAANRRGLLNSSMAVQAGEAAAIDAALPIAQQQAQQIQQSRLTEQQIAGQRDLQAVEIASRELIAGLDREAQERIANLNVAAHDREKATAAMATVAAVYGDMYKTIASNENIPAETRDAYLEHIAVTRDTNLNLLEQLYDFDLVWELSGQPAEEETAP